MRTSIILVIICIFLLASEAILSQNGSLVTVNPIGEITAIPAEDNFVNPNKEVRVEKTPQGTFLIDPNFRIHPNPNTLQAEVIITRNKQFPNIMFASATTFWPPFGPITGKSLGIYVSTNGGVSWYGADTINTGASTPQIGTDPAPVIDKNGRFIITNLLYPWGGPAQGIVSNYSTNYGLNFSLPDTIRPGSANDKNMSCTDDVPSSPYYGRTYTAWFAIGFRYTLLSYTTNGGESWSTPLQINFPPNNYQTAGCDLRTGLNGEVYVIWPETPFIPTLGVEDYHGFAKSTNGGVSFTTNENIYDANGIRGFLPTKGNIRVNSWPRMDVDKSGGQRNGWIYVVGCDKNLPPSGSDPDIILHRSTDGGSTWSPGIRVNQDALNNGAIQFFPAITVDDYGGINIVYYDDRNVGGQLSQVYVSRSTDGGNTWVDFQVSDHSFVVAPFPSSNNGFMGDYIGICYSNGKIWPIWMDNSSGQMQAWTTSVITGIQPISNEIPDNYLLSQNYPNPFNPTTKIQFALPKSSFATLVVYDALGREVSILVNEQLNTGTYEVNWDAGNYSSGVYFYKLTAGDFVETKKMVLIR